MVLQHVVPEVLGASQPSRSNGGDAMELAGSRGELLRVSPLSDRVTRVTHLPRGAGSYSSGESWVVSAGDEGGGPWPRDDLSRFAALNGETGALPALSVARDADGDTAAGASFRASGAGGLATARVRVAPAVGPEPGSASPASSASGPRYQPFRVEWFLEGAEESFASDSFLGAYAYDVGGAASHRMDRREDEGEAYFGLGEVSGPLNRAGRRFELRCRDAMGYDAETSTVLYKHFPLVITHNKKHGVAYGILYDHLGDGHVDLGMELSAFRGTFRTFESDAGFVDYYFIVGPSVAEVVQAAGALVGRPAVPPGWALGYVASTMTYADAPDAQRRLEAFPQLCVQHDMPCDGFYLSSGYTMDDDGNRNVFTWNEGRCPDPPRLLEAFHAAPAGRMGVIANVKPWLLAAHPDYEEVRRLGCFFRRPEPPGDSAGDEHVVGHSSVPSHPPGEHPVVGWFWKGGPGTFAAGSYLDFTNPATAAWWKARLKAQVLGPGVDAVWNDNNEFEIDDGAALCARGDAAVGTLGRALQTLLMARASFEALQEHAPLKRPLVVSRSGCLGISRFAAQTWSGDNSTSFHTLKWNIPMSLGLSLCGWVGNGADVGGFAGAAVSPELLLRWVQLGVFMARFSIHSCSWKEGADEEGEKEAGADRAAQKEAYNLDATNEPWMFPEVAGAVREMLRLRCRLRALLMSLHVEAAGNSFPVTRPLVFRYAADADDRSRSESFEFTLGTDLLVAAVLESGHEAREVYFPGDCEGAQWCDLHTGAWHAGGSTVAVDAPLQGRAYGAPVFLRSGGGLVLFKSHARSGAGDDLEIVLAHASTGRVEVAWFQDDTLEQQGILPAKPKQLRVVAHATHDNVEIREAPKGVNIAFTLPVGDVRTITIALQTALQ